MTTAAQQAAQSTEVPSIAWEHAVALGLTQAGSEFLPISSSGHLILLGQYLGYSGATSPLSDKKGIDTKQTHGSGMPTADTLHKTRAAACTVGIPVRPSVSDLDSFCVCLQGVSMLALALFFRKGLWHLTRGLIQRTQSSWNLARTLTLGTLPPALLGFATKDWIERYAFRSDWVAINLILGALVIFVAEAFLPQKNEPQVVRVARHDDALPFCFGSLSTTQALLLGLCQCVALLPGMSRCLCGLIGAYLIGLRGRAAVELSFLLGLMIVSAASVYKLWRYGSDLWAHIGPSALISGSLSCFIASSVLIPFMLRLLEHRSLTPFGVYRILLGLGLIASRFS